MERSGVMLRRESDSRGLFSSGDTSDNDYEMGAGCGASEGACLCEPSPCTLYSEAHTPTPPRPWRNTTGEETLLCEHCGKNRKMVTRYSEGYGQSAKFESKVDVRMPRSFFEECGLSDPQGESDADADIEDTDSRLQEPGSLQRISSRRRKRPRIARQDTTESEDDGGHSHRTHRWNLRLSPTHNRPILEESISQVRPLIICPPSADRDSVGEPSRSKTSLLVLWFFCCSFHSPSLVRGNPALSEAIKSDQCCSYETSSDWLLAVCLSVTPTTVKIDLSLSYGSVLTVGFRTAAGAPFITMHSPLYSLLPVVRLGLCSLTCFPSQRLTCGRRLVGVTATASRSKKARQSVFLSEFQFSEIMEEAILQCSMSVF
ncbi:hypothetical protein WMY93_015074 [Mugilogobius chulae]|uniref:GATA-type domain-containing protein n=1 Tax=Mugilogobius chulae TaxID=88201 RepID=A0AAW0P308_9GOBI